MRILTGTSWDMGLPKHWGPPRRPSWGNWPPVSTAAPRSPTTTQRSTTSESSQSQLDGRRASVRRRHDSSKYPIDSVRRSRCHRYTAPLLRRARWSRRMGCTPCYRLSSRRCRSGSRAGLSAHFVQRLRQPVAPPQHGQVQPSSPPLAEPLPAALLLPAALVSPPRRLGVRPPPRLRLGVVPPVRLEPAVQLTPQPLSVPRSPPHARFAPRNRSSRTSRNPSANAPDRLNAPTDDPPTCRATVLR